MASDPGHRSARNAPGEQTWSRLRPTICRLYLDEQLTLSDLIRTIRDNHGFHATKAQYERKLKEWGVRKNLRAEEWRAIGANLAQRQRQHKKSEVIVNGVRIPPTRLAREFKRYYSTPLLDKGPQSMKLPPGTRIKTPPLPSVEDNCEAGDVRHELSIVRSSDPWRSGEEMITNHSVPRSSMSDGRRSGSISVERLPLHERVSKTPLGQTMRWLSKFPLSGAWSLLDKVFSSNDRSASRTEGALQGCENTFGPISPANKSKGIPDFDWPIIRQSSQSSGFADPNSIQLQGPRDTHISDDSGTRTLLYILSNRIMPIRTISDMLASVVDEKSISVMDALFSLDTPTIWATWETLIVGAMESNGSTLRTLISIGLRRTEWIKSNGGTFCSLVARKSATEGLELLQRLLDVGISPNNLPSEPTRSRFKLRHAIEEATSNQDYETISLLLKAGATIGNPILHLAIGGDDYSSILRGCMCLQLLISAGAQVDAKLPRNDQGEQDQGEQVWGSEEDWNLAHLGWYRPKEPLTTLEYSFFRGDIEQYNLLRAHSRVGFSTLTVSGILYSASRGLLKDLLDTRPLPTGIDRQRTLEVALSEAVDWDSSEGNTIIRAIIKHGVDPNAPSLHQFGSQFDSWTPLMRAVFRHEDGLVSLLLDEGARINDTNTLWAALCQHPIYPKITHEDRYRTLQLLLSHGANVQKFGTEAMLAAAQDGNLRAVRTLINAGADLTATVDGVRFLRGLLRSRPISFDAIQLVISAGIDIADLVDPGSGGELLCEILDQSISTTASSGNPYALEKVAWDLHDNISLTNLHRPNGQGKQTMDDAIRIIQRLIQLGVKVEHTSNERDSFLTTLILSQKDNSLVQELILEGAASVNHWSKASGGRTPLQAAAGLGDLDIVEMLLEKGADIVDLPAPENGRTALQAAAEEGHEHVVRFLLDKGAQINADPSLAYGRTALQACCERGHFRLAKLLLECGADVNARPGCHHGMTALQAACQYGDVELVQLLLEHGADFNAPGSSTGGMTALSIAAFCGHLGNVIILLDAGAEVNTVESLEVEKCPLDYAASSGRLDTVAVLMDAGGTSAKRGMSVYDGAIELAEKNGSFATAHFIRQSAGMNRI